MKHHSRIQRANPVLHLILPRMYGHRMIHCIQKHPTSHRVPGVTYQAQMVATGGTGHYNYSIGGVIQIWGVWTEPKHPDRIDSGVRNQGLLYPYKITSMIGPNWLVTLRKIQVPCPLDWTDI